MARLTLFAKAKTAKDTEIKASLMPPWWVCENHGERSDHLPKILHLAKTFPV